MGMLGVQDLPCLYNGNQSGAPMMKLAEPFLLEVIYAIGWL